MIAHATNRSVPSRLQQTALLELCRWAFSSDELELLGCLYPQACAGGLLRSSSMQTDCVLEPRRDIVRLEVRVRFWQIFERSNAELELPLHQVLMPAEQPVDDLAPDAGLAHSSRPPHAVEREINLSSVWLRADRSSSLERAFSFPSVQKLEVLPDGHGGVAGIEHFHGAAICGLLEIQSRPVGDGYLKIRVRIVNQTPGPRSDLNSMHSILLHSFVSTHTILHTQDGEFLSHAQPGGYMDLFTECENRGTWPVLVGSAELGERHTILSSAEVYQDYPRLSAEFDTRPRLMCKLPVEFVDEVRMPKLTIHSVALTAGDPVTHGSVPLRAQQ